MTVSTFQHKQHCAGRESRYPAQEVLRVGERAEEVIPNLLRDAPGSVGKSAVAPLAVSLVWFVPLLCLAGLGWLGWHYLGDGIKAFGLGYLSLLEWLTP